LAFLGPIIMLDLVLVCGSYGPLELWGNRKVMIFGGDFKSIWGKFFFNVSVMTSFKVYYKDGSTFSWSLGHGKFCESI